LKQRVSLRCKIMPLAMHEINKYIRFRLKTAGAERVDLFDSEALDLIAQVSLGIPRVINNICDNALLYGYAGAHRTITGEVIREVIQALDISANDFTNNSDTALDADDWQSSQVAAVGATGVMQG
jgi:general secretion pathway protein A